MMSEYPRSDSYLRRSVYDQGIDAKIVIMGNTGNLLVKNSTVLSLISLSGVGKTSLLQRYTQDKFDPKNTTSTTGAFFVTKKVYKDGLKVRLQLWDTAGQERFRSMVCPYSFPVVCYTNHHLTGTHVLSWRKRCSSSI